METLEQRREKQDLLQTFKILRTNDMRGEQTLLVKNNRQNGAATRSTTDPWSLLVPRTRLDIRKHSFTVRAPSLWNKLPANLRAYDDPKMFKRAMKALPKEWVEDRRRTVSSSRVGGPPRAANDDSTMQPPAAKESTPQVSK